MEPTHRGLEVSLLVEDGDHDLDVDGAIPQGRSLEAQQ